MSRSAYGPLSSRLHEVEGVRVLNRGITTLTQPELNNYQVTFKLEFDLNGERVCVLLPQFALMAMQDS